MASPLFANILWIIPIFLGITITDLTASELATGLHLVEGPQDVVAVKKAPLWLPCVVESSIEGGQVNITWVHDGEEISDSRVTVLANGTLYIPRVIHKVQEGRSHEGSYRCYAKNNIGTIFSNAAKVQIASLGRFSGEPQDVTVIQGELVRFQCQVEGTPTPTVTWERDRQPLPQDQRYTSLPTGVFQISNVTKADEGLYRCRAVNMARVRHSAEGQLTVRTDAGPVSASLLSESQDITARTGENVVIECAITSLSHPAVTWTTLKGNPLPRGRHSIVGSSNLALTQVQPSDSDDYICSSESIMSRATLTVIAPPQPTSEPENSSKPSAHTVRFHCTFDGSPTPEVTWYKDGRLIQHDGRVTIREEGTRLVVLNTEPADSGLYQCVGTNEAGESSQVMRLLIYPSDHAPNSPHKLRAEQRSSTSIYLSWVAPQSYQNLAILAYSVHYRPTTGGTELQKVVQETSALITQLQPYTNYSFYVVAYNTEGASDHSDIVTQVTDDDVPAIAPEALVMPLGATSLIVQWDTIPKERARGIITSYRVEYRPSGSHLYEQFTLGGNVHEYIISDLQPDVLYDVRVAAGTRKGFPDLDEKEWPWVSQLTNSDSNIGLPGVPDMEVVTLNTTAIKVTWSEPIIIGDARLQDIEEIVGYKLRFHKPGQESRLLILVKEDHSKTLTKLVPDTWYEISLKAFNNKGDGEMAVKSVKTMENPGSGPRPPFTSLLPPAPLFFNAEPINSSAISVTWRVPRTDPPITYYTVRYKPVRSSNSHGVINSSQTKEVASTSPHRVISGLDVYTEYSFAIRSHTDTQMGPFSAERRVKTLEGRPTAPRNPSGKLAGPKAVELRWMPPAESNGVILTYVIFYSVDDSSPDNMWRKHQENGSSTHAVVDDLSMNELYYFKLRAATSAGEGPPTDIIKIQTSELRADNPQSEKPHTDGGALRTSDRDMGIIVGVCIGGGCIIICAVIVILRNRCFPPRPSPPDPNASYHGNGYLINANGNGMNGYLSHTQLVGHPCNLHEMDSFVPILSHIPENADSDTKGGTYIRLNGGMSGMFINGVQGRVPPNGKCKSYIIQDQSFLENLEDGPQVPLRSCSLHGQVLTGEPIMVQLSSLEDIDRSYTTDLGDQMKASPSSSGVTDCTQGPVDPGTSSNVSSENASLESRGHRSSQGSRKAHVKPRDHKRARSQMSPHSTLSTSSTSSASSTPTAVMATPTEGNAQEILPCLHQATSLMCSKPSQAKHTQEHPGMSVLTHISCQGHGPGRPASNVTCPQCMELPPGQITGSQVEPVLMYTAAVVPPLSRSQNVASSPAGLSTNHDSTRLASASQSSAISNSDNASTSNNSQQGAASDHRGSHGSNSESSQPSIRGHNVKA